MEPVITFGGKLLVGYSEDKLIIRRNRMSCKMEPVPSLFGKDSKGNIKLWRVHLTKEGYVIEHGRLGGKLQTRETVVKIKNVGKANETSILEQSLKEAKAKWKKQLDKGYSETPDGSSRVMNPMLATDYKKGGHRVDYSHSSGVYVQPKLDGVRCEVSLNSDGKIEFKSRGGKFYKVPEHIEKDLLPIFKDWKTVKLDGELYIHGKYLQEIVSAVKKPNKLTPKLEFCCFDLPSISENSSSLSWRQRKEYLRIFRKRYTTCNVSFIEDFYVRSFEEVLEYHKKFTDEGYEGVMIRTGYGFYTYNVRSPWLLKYKHMIDSEFTIVSHEVDKDKCVVWVIKVPSKTGEVLCKVTPKMSKDDRRALALVATTFYGKLLKVQFQGYTKGGNLSFPVGIELDRTDS